MARKHQGLLIYLKLSDTKSRTALKVVILYPVYVYFFVEGVPLVMRHHNLVFMKKQNITTCTHSFADFPEYENVASIFS